MTRDRDASWYAGGLRFICSECGDCCRGDGDVWVGRAEIEVLASYLELSVETFGRRYLRRNPEGRLALLDQANRDCVFWDGGCTVYPARPGQCRTFPFWEENLESPRAWGQAARRCPGMNHGQRYRQSEIDRLAAGTGET